MVHEGFDDFISVFINHAETIIGELPRLYTADQLEEVAALSYSVKSLACVIGLTQLADSAKILEEEARIQITSGGKISNVPQYHINELIRNLEDAMSLLQNGESIGS